MAHLVSSSAEIRIDAPLLHEKIIALYCDFNGRLVKAIRPGQSEEAKRAHLLALKEFSEQINSVVKRQSERFQRRHRHYLAHQSCAIIQLEATLRAHKSTPQEPAIILQDRIPFIPLPKALQAYVAQFLSLESFSVRACINKESHQFYQTLSPRIQAHLTDSLLELHDDIVRKSPFKTNAVGPINACLVKAIPQKCRSLQDNSWNFEQMIRTLTHWITTPILEDHLQSEECPSLLKGLKSCLDVSNRLKTFSLKDNREYTLLHVRYARQLLKEKRYPCVLGALDQIDATNVEYHHLRFPLIVDYSRKACGQFPVSVEEFIKEEIGRRCKDSRALHDIAALIQKLPLRSEFKAYALQKISESIREEESKEPDQRKECLIS